MSVAQRANSKRSIKASIVGEDDDGPFQCHSCGTSVDHVNGYWTRKDDPNLAREIKAFFRLTKNHEHGSGCVYIPGAQLERIVREAEAVEDSINPFAKEPEKNLWIFRLNIPMEEQEREIEAEPTLKQATERERVERVWNGKRIESYCRSAVGLAKLWRALESSDGRDELRSKVRIAVGGQTVPWEEFFFTDEAIGEFANRIEAKQLSYPIALLLHVKEIKTTALGLQVIFTHIKDETAPTATRIAVEAFGSMDTLKGFLLDNHYIVFGNFFYQKTNPWRNTITFRDIRINTKAQ